MATLKKLSDLETGSFAIVRELEAGSNVLTRLRELGVLPGTRIQLVRRAPLGDPIEISVRGSLLSVRAQEASLIAIEVTA